MQQERCWRGSILGGTGPRCGQDARWSRGGPHVVLTALSLASLGAHLPQPRLQSRPLPFSNLAEAGRHQIFNVINPGEADGCVYLQHGSRQHIPW